MKFKLTIDMIPACNWGENLHNYLDAPIWDSVRREVYTHFNLRCAICGASNTKLHCHEDWDINDKKCAQKLRGFLALCEDCHNVKHWGRTTAVIEQGKLDPYYKITLTKHFCRVNDCGTSDFEKHAAEARSKWSFRANRRYKLNWGKFSPDRITREYMKQNAKRKR